MYLLLILCAKRWKDTKNMDITVIKMKNLNKKDSYDFVASGSDDNFWNRADEPDKLLYRNYFITHNKEYELIKVFKVDELTWQLYIVYYWFSKNLRFGYYTCSGLDRYQSRRLEKLLTIGR